MEHKVGGHKTENISINGEKVSDMTGTELLRVSDSIKAYVEDNLEHFDTTPVREIHMNSQSFKVRFNEHASFWDRMESKAWEPETFEVFDTYLKPDMTFVDVGAWIGSTLLYASQRVKSSFAFEPDPLAFKELAANVKLNSSDITEDSIRLYKAAVGTEAGELKLGSAGEGGDSLSSVLHSESENSWVAKAVSLERVLAEHASKDDPIFCKVDIEGYEYALIPELGSLLNRPNTWFFVSLHPQFLWREIQEKKKLSKGVFGRISFVKSHLKLLKSLSYFDLRYVTGKPFNARKELLKALISGSFPNGLLALPKS